MPRGHVDGQNCEASAQNRSTAKGFSEMKAGMTGHGFADSEFSDDAAREAGYQSNADQPHSLREMMRLLLSAAAS